MLGNRYATSLAFVALLAHTAAAQVPPNDACSAAIPLTCGQSVAGSTLEATTDIEAFACVTSVQAAGIWYSYVGTGDAVTVSTCLDWTFDTRINVYRGGCAALLCVGGNDDSGDCDLGSTVSFATETGITYYILVQGYQGSVGTFEMSVECAPVTNDLCEGATAITCNQSLSGSTVGATFDAAGTCEFSLQAPGVWYTFTGIGDPVTLSTCESSDYDTRINVYRGNCAAPICVTGNDDTPGVGTCSTVSFPTDPEETYYILVYGYDGETGNFSLEMVCQTCGTPTAVSSAASQTTAFIYWQSLNEGATYTIEYGPLGFAQGTGTLATGTVTNANATAEITDLDPGTEYSFYLREECTPEDASPTVGVFTFTTLADEPAVNSVCSTPLPIACGESVDGDTGESFFTPGPTCGPSNITAPSLWYSFVGNGETVTLSTCDSAAYDTKLSVYSGGCDDLICVSGSDDAPGCGDNTSRLVLPTMDGVEYLVRVHGYADEAGGFTLTMSCAPTCGPIAANDECTNATPIAPNGIGQCDPTSGNNACAFATGVPNPPCDPYDPIVDVWYVFNTGNQTTFTVLAATLSAEEVSAAVYEDCGSLEYVDCNVTIDLPWQVNNLAPFTDHYLRIWNGGGDLAGSFAICLETDFTTAIGTANAPAAVRSWPNPANEMLTLEGALGQQIAIHDLQGRIVLTAPTNNAALLQLDIRTLAPGSYAVQSVDGARMLGRFIKE